MKINQLDIITKKFVRIYLILFTVFIYSSVCFSQKTAWDNHSFSNAVHSLFWEKDVLSGFSITFEKTAEEEIVLQTTSYSVEISDLLNEIVKFNNRYEWRDFDGVYNVFPKNDYEILNTRISNFKSENLSLAKLKEQIINIPEFQIYLKENNLIDKILDTENKYGFLCCGFLGKESSMNNVSINLKNATIREILNEIVRTRGVGGWTYREFEIVDDGKSYKIYRLEF
jgi:hypothetical protein